MAQILGSPKQTPQSAQQLSQLSPPLQIMSPLDHPCAPLLW
jgi:hypothetical protein